MYRYHDLFLKWSTHLTKLLILIKLVTCGSHLRALHLLSHLDAQELVWHGVPFGVNQRFVKRLSAVVGMIAPHHRTIHWILLYTEP